METTPIKRTLELTSNELNKLSVLLEAIDDIQKTDTSIVITLKDDVSIRTHSNFSIVSNSLIVIQSRVLHLNPIDFSKASKVKFFQTCEKLQNFFRKNNGK